MKVMKEVRETLYFGREGGREKHYCVRCSDSSRYSSYKQHENQDFRIVRRSVSKYRQRKFGWHVNATVHNLKI